MLQRELDRWHPLKFLGTAIITPPLIFCSMELGWQQFNTGLSPAILYLIAIFFGGLGGVFCGQTYPVPGALGGIVGTVGGLLAASAVLSQVDSIQTSVLTLVTLAGSLPGFGLFFLLAFAQDAVYPAPQRPAPSSTQQRRKRGPDLGFLNETPSQANPPAAPPGSMVSCPYCGMQLANDPRLSGQAVQCPNCHGAFQMP